MTLLIDTVYIGQKVKHMCYEMKYRLYVHLFQFVHVHFNQLFSPYNYSVREHLNLICIIYIKCYIIYSCWYIEGFVCPSNLFLLLLQQVIVLLSMPALLSFIVGVMTLEWIGGSYAIVQIMALILALSNHDYQFLVMYVDGILIRI